MTKDKKIPVLETAAVLATAYRQGVKTVSPYPSATAMELTQGFDTGLPEKGRPGEEIIEQLALASSPGLVGNCGDKFYGWVMGGSHLVGVAADWLTSAWGQNAAIYQTSPAAATAEEVAGKWLVDLLGLPVSSSIGFTTGATMASFICLAAARNEVLARHGWDVDKSGIFGAPSVKVFISEEAHSSIYATLRYLGFGGDCLIRVDADRQGRLQCDDLAFKLETHSGPKIIIAQAGHINSGAFDDFVQTSTLAARHEAWVHVDGAFGLWAQVDPSRRHLCRHVEKADSWAVDGHKWLQIPYDSGFAIIKDAHAHENAMSMSASYLNRCETDGRNPSSFVPELSRRARGFAVWAVLQAFGRQGISELIAENCDNAKALAEILSQVPGIHILNEVCLNQISLSFECGADQDVNDALTRQVISLLQSGDQWFVKEAVWQNRTILRLSFSSTPAPRQQIKAFAARIVEAWRDVQPAS